MVDLATRIAAEKENVERALSDLKDAMARKEKSTIELAAAATFLHNIYSGMEHILKQVLKATGTLGAPDEQHSTHLVTVLVSGGEILPEF